MLQLEQDLLHRLVDAQMGGVDRQFRVLGHLVGIGDAGEFRDQPRARLGVEAFAVARLGVKGSGLYFLPRPA